MWEESGFQLTVLPSGFLYANCSIFLALYLYWFRCGILNGAGRFRTLESTEK